jgi:hypothetical protein
MFAATAGGTYRTLFRQHTVLDGIFGSSANAMMVLVDCTRELLDGGVEPLLTHVRPDGEYRVRGRQNPFGRCGRVNDFQYEVLNTRASTPIRLAS